MDAAPGGLAAFILAGGKSSRMGSDKAFLEFEGRTLLARALALARSITSDVRIVGQQEKFAHFAPTVADIFPDRGPLAGIHAALCSSEADLNLILAVDTPYLSWALLRFLISQAQNAPDAMVVVPRCDGRSQPLCALYRRPFSVVAEKSLRSGQNKIDRLFSEVPARMVEQEELETAGFSPAIFRNLNTPFDLETAQRPVSSAKM